MKGRSYIQFLLIAILFAGCFSAHENSFQEDPIVSIDLDEIKKRGYLTAIVDNNSVSYFIYKGRPMGYEYELLQQLAEYLKVDLKIKLTTSIEEAIDQLNTGQGDVLAFPLTITKERTNYVSFTNTHFNTYQVLVQKKPANWRMQPPMLVEKKMLRNPADLIGKEVYVKKGSAFKERLENLSHEVGGDILIIEDSVSGETEALIRKVATGEIKYTVTDQMIAMVNQLYYPNIDINTVVSLPQQIAWAVRKNSPQLLAASNDWLIKVKNNSVFQVIYNKYFNSPRFSLNAVSSDFSSLGGNKLSPYDEQLKEGAAELNWDWRLLASVVYQESNFNPNVQSWAGAVGLMQVMPETGEFFDIGNLWDPKQNIKAGVKFLKFLDNHWAKSVTDPQERIKFVLASYNVGLSHVIDAQKLTRKYGRNISQWNDHVEFFLLKKSEPLYYRDSLSAAGYCRCNGPVTYVKEVLNRFEEYKALIRD